MKDHVAFWKGSGDGGGGGVVEDGKGIEEVTKEQQIREI